MPFRFRRSIRIAPGLRINVSRSGFSTSVGPRGAKVTFGKRGARGSVGIPGTGMSYSERIGRPGGAGRIILALFIVAVLAVFVGLILH